jgi:PAS domain S-box-containing protein
MVAPAEEGTEDVHRERLTASALLVTAAILLAGTVLFGVGFLFGVFSGDVPLAALALAVLSAAAWRLVRGSARWQAASLVIPGATLALAFVDTWRYGLSTLVLLQYVGVLIFAAVLLGRRWQLVFLGGCLAGINVQAATVWLRGGDPAARAGALSDAVAFSLFLVLCGALLRLFVGEFESALRGARAQAAALARDNQERQRAAEALLESEDRYRRLAETLSDFAYAGRFDERRGFIRDWASGEPPAELGITANELGDIDHFLAIVHPDDRARFRDLVERVRGGEAGVTEFRLVGRDGLVVWMRDFVTPVCDRSGRVIGVCGAAQNITERKRAEDALRAILASTVAARPERVFESVAESVREWLGVDAVLVAEAVEDGGLQTVSLRVDGRAGSQRSLALDGTAWGAIARDGYLVVAQGARARFPEDAELAHLEAEGCAGLPLRDSQGRAIGILALVSRRSLSLPAQTEEGLGVIATIAAAELERRKAAQAREAMEERLRQSEKMEAIGRLAGGVAHDFNNQLVGIMGFAELLLARATDEATRAQVERILTASRRAADLTRQLLAFGRRGQLVSVPVDLNATIREVIDLLDRSIDKRIRVHQALVAARPATLGDPSLLQSALLNVALNARDAMPEGGDLTFATENVVLDEGDSRRAGPEAHAGKYVRVRIADTGVGMDAEMLRRVFEPFFTTKEPGKGTGMGLAAVYGTVQAHGGWVDVASQVGAGTTFALYLPEAEVEGVAVALPPPPAAKPAATSAHLLVADDEEIVREMMTEALTDLGYRVTTCVDGEEAVDAYRTHWREIDLVILDLIMPKIGGHEAFLAMERCNADLRVLLCSGYSLSEGARALLTQRGVVGFLQKPFEVDELARVVAEALGRS